MVGAHDEIDQVGGGMNRQRMLRKAGPRGKWPAISRANLSWSSEAVASREIIRFSSAMTWIVLNLGISGLLSPVRMDNLLIAHI
jgi:hypothetical protein